MKPLAHNTDTFTLHKKGEGEEGDEKETKTKTKPNKMKTHVKYKNNMKWKRTQNYECKQINY